MQGWTPVCLSNITTAHSVSQSCDRTGSVKWPWTICHMKPHEETVTSFRIYRAQKDGMKDWRDLFCVDFLVIYNIYPHSYHGSQTSRYLTTTPPELWLAVQSETPPPHTFILSLFTDILMIYLLQTWIIYNKITILVIQSSCFYTTVIVPCSSIRDLPRFRSDNWKVIEFFWKTLPHWYRGCCSRQIV